MMVSEIPNMGAIQRSISPSTSGQVKIIAISDSSTEHDITVPTRPYAGFIVKSDDVLEAVKIQLRGDTEWATVNGGFALKFDIQGNTSPGKVKGVSGSSFNAEIIFLCV